MLVQYELMQVRYELANDLTPAKYRPPNAKTSSLDEGEKKKVGTASKSGRTGRIARAAIGVEDTESKKRPLDLAVGSDLSLDPVDKRIKLADSKLSLTDAIR